MIIDVFKAWVLDVLNSLGQTIKDWLFQLNFFLLPLFILLFDKSRKISLQRATADKCNCRQTCASTGHWCVSLRGATQAEESR